MVNISTKLAQILNIMKEYLFSTPNNKYIVEKLDGGFSGNVQESS